MLIGEVWLPDQERFARYLRPDELHTAFNFDFLACPWEPAELRRVIDPTLATHAPVGAPPTWVLSNHDVTRPVTRYGRAGHLVRRTATACTACPPTSELGHRRARAAALLAMALPGGVYVYQGEELGLPEVEDIPDELRQDPMWHRSGRHRPGPGRLPGAAARGRATSRRSASATGTHRGCRSRESWRKLTAEAQAADLGSMLNLYRTALRHPPRRARATARSPGWRWVPRCWPSPGSPA